MVAALAFVQIVALLVLIIHLRLQVISQRKVSFVSAYLSIHCFAFYLQNIVVTLLS